MQQFTQEYAKTKIKGEIKPLVRAKMRRGFVKSGSTWINKGAVFNVAELRNNRLAYAQPHKRFSIQWLCEVFPDAVFRIFSRQPLTLQDIERLPYYEYLVARLHPSANLGGVPSNSGKKHILDLIYDLIALCKDIQDNGVKAPLDMYMDGDHPVLIRGHRRLEIMYQLGIKTTAVRVWRTVHLARTFIPPKVWPEPGITVHGEAIKQFIKYGHKATDKYWVHNYTPYYDFHLRHRRRDKMRILELGVLGGMSLRLWEKAFPRARIFGLDIKPRVKSKGRVEIIKGDENDLNFLKEVGEKYGNFDLIIDDALHKPDPQRNSFLTLWEYLNSGGVYVVEDLHPNYHRRYKNNSAMPTFMDRIHSIWTDYKVKGVSFYPNICFLTKA